MIVVDIETTGLTHNHGICEIAAIDLRNSENQFCQEAKIDDEDLVKNTALEVNERNKEELYDQNKQSQKELIENYLDWIEEQTQKIFIGQNIQWDMNMIESKCLKYGMWERYNAIHRQRGIDLHTMAQNKYEEIHGTFLIDEQGKSSMGLSEILDFCGMKDQRSKFSGNTKVEEGEPHVAKKDCKLEGECYWRIKYGKNLFPEFSEIAVPNYLKQ